MPREQPIVSYELRRRERLRALLFPTPPAALYRSRVMIGAIAGFAIYSVLRMWWLPSLGVREEVLLFSVLYLGLMEFRLSRADRRVDALIEVLGRDEIERHLVQRMQRVAPLSDSAAGKPA